MADDSPIIDLGRHCRRCHYSERAKEKVAHCFPYAVPAGRRDSIRDDPGYSIAGAAIEGRCAGHLWYRAQSRLAGLAWRLDCGIAL